ncbi:MAG TPA: chemotaxis protein CheW [Isosphaeraceae bacterium]|jgi:purine-binding chemotaxis protein CheW|nr:chemotaxis protein CheW [Isosphaeraceae bacterium]
MMPPEMAETAAWCLFRSDAEPLAVALGAVVEVVEAKALARWPAGVPRVLGLCSYRRGVLPVVRLTEPAPGVEDGATPLVLVLRKGVEAWGIRVDRGGTAVRRGGLDPAGAGRASAVGGRVRSIGMIEHEGAAFLAVDAADAWEAIRAEVVAHDRAASTLSASAAEDRGRP